MNLFWLNIYTCSRFFSSTVLPSSWYPSKISLVSQPSPCQLVLRGLAKHFNQTPSVLDEFLRVFGTKVALVAWGLFLPFPYCNILASLCFPLFLFPQIAIRLPKEKVVFPISIPDFLRRRCLNILIIHFMYFSPLYYSKTSNLSFLILKFLLGVLFDLLL